ncbi:MAG TPA: hypothetical protein VIH88_04870 [Candidatus Acidoferrales bacterium]
MTQHKHRNPANFGENEIVESNPQTQSLASVLAQAVAFVRQHALRIMAISVAVLVPVFWHRNIAAGDLGSHLYNAWLAQLIRHGQVPGLWLAPRWNNVLFDFLLVGLGRFVSLHVAEKIAVALAVLIFFWGAFAFVCAATKRVPWLLCPVIAMFSYGYSFEMGFLNFYISLGLAFFGIAIFWRGLGWERLIPIVLAPLAMLAHPLGFAWLVAASAYVAIAEAIPRRYQIVLVAAAGVVLFAARYYFWHHDIVQARDDPFHFFNGSDQLLLFGPRYAIPEFALLIFILCALATTFFSRPWGKFRWEDFAVPLELYLVVGLAVILLPDGIRFPQQSSALALLTERLTSVSAVLLCCLLGSLPPRRWHLLACGAIAAIFFTFLYQDTGTINRMETQVEQLVRTLPRNSRVLATLKPPFPESRILVQHIADRACIGHCFSYGNYEPGSGQFRVRATPRNLYAMSSFDSAVNMEDGSYELQPEDLPAYQVYQCSADQERLCIRPLAAGEMNDDLGIHPNDE